MFRYPAFTSALLAVVLLAVAAPSVSVAPAYAQAPEYETTQIDDGVYQFRWRSHNGFFVVGDEGVVAFDPISTDAAAAYAREIRRVAPGRGLLAVVYSHRHADHATGARVLMDELGAEAPIIAHARTYDHLGANPDPDLPAPHLTFRDRLTLHPRGGPTIELRYLGPSHADDIVVAHLPERGIVFAVDFVANNSVGYRDLSSFHFPELFDAIRGLRALDFGTAVFGHGPPGDRAAIDRQLAYYTELRDTVARALDRGLSEDEAAERIALPRYADWRGYDDWFALNVRGMYRWLASERR